MHYSFHLQQRETLQKKWSDGDVESYQPEHVQDHRQHSLSAAHFPRYSYSIQWRMENFSHQCVCVWILYEIQACVTMVL